MIFRRKAKPAVRAVASSTTTPPPSVDENSGLVTVTFSIRGANTSYGQAAMIVGRIKHGDENMWVRSSKNGLVVVTGDPEPVHTLVHQLKETNAISFASFAATHRTFEDTCRMGNYLTL